MAESVASFLLNKIGLLLQEEINLLKGVRTEIEYVKDEFEHIKVFLRVAESMEDTDDQATVWINQVREIAFEIEDVIDDFTLRLAHDRTDMESCGLMNMTIRHVKNFKYRHQIAAEIRRIKPRITDVSARRERYRLAAPQQGSSSSSTYTNTSSLWQEHRTNALLQDEADLVGIDKPKMELIRFLTDGDSELKVVSVVGMGGLGKTTLSKKVFDNVKNQFDKYAWINVSQTFKVEELLKNLFRKLGNQSGQPYEPQGLEKMSSDVLKETIKEYIRGSRYLIVLDDIWQTEAWISISYAFPANKCGSRVLLTTRKIEVANASGGCLRGIVYTMQPLSRKESRTLFCMRLFCGHDCPPELLAIAGEILEKCKGLPLAIVAICGLLATRSRSKIEWEMVKRSIPSELDGGRLSTVEKILLLSYYDLPFYLKACVLYVCMFPEDYEIEGMRLIRLWIAEGFVQEQERMTLEDVAEGYLNELLNRSLIQVVGWDRSKRIRTYCIHDILREVFLEKAKDQNFMTIISGEKEGKMWQKKVARRWSVHNSSGNIVHKEDTNRNISKLRSLLVLGVRHFQFFEMSSSNDLRLLTVLELRGTNLVVFPKAVLKLYHLKYLSLRYTQIGALPPSIRKLQNLETLDLKHTPVNKLPATIVNLRNLRHLLSYSRSISSKQTYAFTGIRSVSRLGCLQSLQKLCFIKVNEDDAKDKLEEIGKLKQLRRLGIGNLRFSEGKTLCSTIEKLPCLRTLWIESETREEIIDLQHIISPPQFLQRMYIYGSLENTPKWFSCLENLSKLELADSRLMDDLLEPIQALPSLQHLVFDTAFCGEKLKFKAGGFRKLKLLWAWRLHGLRMVEVEKGALANLEELYMWDCQLLKNVPFGIEHLAKLRLLILQELSEYLLNGIDKDGGGNDYWRVKDISNIRISNFRIE